MSAQLEHLFRRESARLTAALVRVLGLAHLALAKDVVQEAFCRALESWPFTGTPRDPAAWLMTTARHCAMDALRRERTVRRAQPLLTSELQSEWTLTQALEELFEPQAAKHDLLRMMFSCCHPRLPQTGQVALILHILCGFGVDEVAAAFVSNEATMARRIARAKSTLARSGVLFNVTAARDFEARLPAVQRALYLLFNEGYHGASADVAVNAELCREARRLMTLLLVHPLGATPASHALAALMAFHAARLPGRLDANGDLLALADQDRARWDRPLIDEGLKYLELSAAGTALSAYHLEAAIASLHATAPSLLQTDWHTIVGLYDSLLSLTPSPIVALNRAIAIAQAQGPEQGLVAIRAVAGRERLAKYPFYSAALGELEARRGNCAAARAHFGHALTLARNPAERSFLRRRMEEIRPDPDGASGTGAAEFSAH